MKIRFLQTRASSNPAYPFQMGQTIEIPKLVEPFRAFLAEGAIEIVKEAAPIETAVLEPTEETSTAAKRRPRATG
jgi:hypothetical protein